jgi:Tol biopolymer transport system component
MIGTHLGPYEITAKLGEGGMGEVYRATDSKLRRQVAIKVLPAALTAHREHLTRFEREAQMLAQLHHPNIASIFGVEDSGATRALVMELVEGPTLAERLERGPFAVGDALAVALQIAHALEAAHEKGIVHRDLKPQNIKAPPEGRVKVLDFGLAKALQPAPGSPRAAEVANSPTLPLGATREGTLLGTAGYMAPEQARGTAVDARADLWALGVILFEMLTGERLFAEASMVETLSAVMRKPIDLGRLPAGTPPRLRELLGRLLERQPADRLHHVADARIVLAELVREGGAAWTASTPPAVAARNADGSRSRWLAMLAALAIGALLGYFGSVRLDRAAGRRAGAPETSEVRFRLAPPPGAQFANNVENLYLAVSPDGSTLAFIGAEKGSPSRVWLHRLDELEARPLAGTEGARSLTFSPDGRTIAFVTGAKLKRIELGGGAAVPICDVPPAVGVAASWGAAGDILFATVLGNGIHRVSAAGGVAEQVVDAGEGEAAVRTTWPRHLPDGQAFLYLESVADRTTRLMLVEPDRPARAVAPLDSRFELVGSDLLVFAREGVLYGQRFGRAAPHLTGVPVAIAPKVRYFYSSGWAGFATSPGGTLVLLSEDGKSRLIWFNRQGQQVGTVGPEGAYLNLSLSRDGRTLLTDRAQPGPGTYDLWKIDLERGVESRLTSSPDADFGALALDGGKSIVYSALRSTPGAPNLVRRELATGHEEHLLPSRSFQAATDVSPDGRLLAFVDRSASGKFQAWTLHLDGEGGARRLFDNDEGQAAVRFSPDGESIAYLSDASGTFEAYVSPLAAPLQATRLSAQGATKLRWHRDGGEVFLLTPDRKLVSVVVRTEPELDVGPATTLFALPGTADWLDFVVSPDARRFLAIVNERVGGEQPATVIHGWRLTRSAA